MNADDTEVQSPTSEVQSPEQDAPTDQRAAGILPAEPPPPDPEEPSAPPPAATIVVNGTRTEREIELEAELQRERQAREEAQALIKAREIECATLADENHRLKTPAAVPVQIRRGPLGIRTSDE